MRTWRWARPADVVVVGDDGERHAVAVQLVEHLQDRLRVRAVQVAGRFVGEQQARLGDQRPRDRDPLPFAAGQRGRREVHPVAEPDPVQRPPGPRHPFPRGHPDVHHRSATFSSTVRWSSRWNAWKTNPIRSPRSTARRRSRRRRSCPRRPAGTSPPVGLSSSPSRCSSVDLPEPDGPTIDRYSPCADGQVHLPDRLHLRRAGEEPPHPDHLHHRRPGSATAVAVISDHHLVALGSLARRSA